MARFSGPELPNDELVSCYKIGDADALTIAVVTDGESSFSISIQKWEFAHPRTIKDFSCKWLSTGGYRIPSNKADHWLIGLRRLLESPRVSSTRDVYCYAIRTPSGREIRFFRSNLSNGRTYNCIQGYIQTGTGLWTHKGPRISWPLEEERIGVNIEGALECAVEFENDKMKADEGLTIVESDCDFVEE